MIVNYAFEYVGMNRSIAKSITELHIYYEIDTTTVSIVITDTKLAIYYSDGY